MTFGYPQFLYLMAATVLLLTVFFYITWNKRKRDIEQFVRSRLLAQLTVGVSAQRKKLRLLLLILAVATIIIALARPRWGFELEEIKQHGLDIVVAIDTSRSMLADDITPNRMMRAKLAALELIPRAKTDRLGLVAFSGTAFLQCPLTLDDEAYRQSVELLDASIIPQGGTAIAEAIEVCLSAFKNDENNKKAIVVMTDGEDHESEVMAAAEKAAKVDVRIFTIGIGTPQGELIRIQETNRVSSFVKDEEGNVVKSRLNESLLQQIASKTEGAYFRLQGANTIDLLYEKGLSPMLGSFQTMGATGGDKSSIRVLKHYYERFQWPLAIAILLMMIEYFLPERQWVRKPKHAAAPSRGATLKHNAMILLCLIFSSQHMQAAASKALKLYNVHKYEESMKEYERLLSRNPKDARLAYNAGVAAYQAGKPDEAVHFLTDSLLSQDLKLQQQAYYNLGNSHFRVGENKEDPNEKMAGWETAVKNYESSLKLDPKDADAKYNLDLVKKRIEELKKQQDQQKQDQKKDSKDDKKDEKKDDKKEDKKDKQNKDGKDSQQDQQKQDQKDKSEEQQKNDQSQKEQKSESPKEQPSKPEDKKEKEEKQPSSPQKSDKGGETNQASEAQSVPLGQMTMEQAKQLLDALKSQEKSILFLPPEKDRQKNRSYKNW